ncbi:hypothetical protein [Streptomyces sp. RPT161]|uniref:hypothetical protein n=1 Tax=Streptomyces sp. RPT161 TaxID=3015993 RepID=UPI0022B8BEB2|nr:hypothetical protein [Streptomyces sp. RPT161]
MDEEVVSAGHVEHRQDFGQRGHILLESFNDLAAERPDLDVQQRLHVPVESRQADLRVVTGDQGCCRRVGAETPFTYDRP